MPHSRARRPGSTGRQAVRDFIPRHSRRLTPDTVASPAGPRVSSLCDVLIYSSKSGVKDGAVSPNFSAAALPFASRKNCSPACKPRPAVPDPSLQQSGRSPSLTKEITS
ncbi:hypothetical protein RPHASCH2410_PD04865 (plasmid) [Rhizobium phaseoli Ch24-10]|nr:hypothetical protein RPHASCH2410_PD04865 [Rhizobium phaseoli Ch24-10]